VLTKREPEDAPISHALVHNPSGRDGEPIRE